MSSYPDSPSCPPPPHSLLSAILFLVIYIDSPIYDKVSQTTLQTFLTILKRGKAKPMSNPESPPKWLADLEKDDIDLLQEFGSLTAAQLMEKVRGLQNLAYQLGLEEAREMTRGKFLNILEKQNRYPPVKSE